MPKRLTKIYTKTGDRGTTRLANGEEVAKTHPLIVLLGTLDELSSVLGIMHATITFEKGKIWIEEIQHDLFDLGGELCLPDYPPRIIPDTIQRLENHIDFFNQELGPLEEFILPGGSLAGAQGHAARSICRRAERELIAFFEVGSPSTDVLAYVNRLSDFLFCLARYTNLKEGAQETLWKNKKGTPGATTN